MLRTHEGRYAGNGMDHDDYSENHRPYRPSRQAEDTHVRLPCDAVLDDEDALAALSGTVKTYYVEVRKHANY